MKFIATLFTAALVTFGAGTAFAGTGNPADCAESDNSIPVGVDCTVDADGVYPPATTTPEVVLPEEGTVPQPEPTTTPPPPQPTVPPTGLPATGSDGSTGMIQIAGLFVAGGLLVWIAARRRNPATAAE